MYRLFEHASIKEFKGKNNEDNINKFIEKAFKENAPLYIMFLLTNERKLIDELFDVNDEFKKSLTLNSKHTNPTAYIMNFTNFLNPYVLDQQFISLYDYILINRLCLEKDKKLPKIDFPAFKSYE